MSAFAARVLGGVLTHPWQRDLFAVASGQLAASVGLQFSLPFLSIFLRDELGIAEPRALALWTGVATGMLGLGLGIAGPIWGVVADRSGRKPMLVRAMLGGALTLAFMGVSTSPIVYAFGWLLFGVLAGTYPAASALIASVTPRTHVAFALGTLLSAQSLGQSIGPAVGGIAASIFGLRPSYFVGAAIEALATLPILLIVRDVGSDDRLQGREATDTPLRLPRSSRMTIAIILVGMALYVTSFVGMQRITALRLIEIAPTRAAFLTGIAFTLLGIATAGAAIALGRLSHLLGYRRLAFMAIGLITVALIGAASTRSEWMVVAMIGLAGIANGTGRPAMQAMLTLEAPSGRLATVFGFVQLTSASGLLLGPLIAGSIAAAFDTSAALVVLAGFSVGALVPFVSTRHRGNAVGGSPMDPADTPPHE